MGAFPGDGARPEASRDPLARVLLGCALVAAALLAVLVLGALIVGWRWTRDTAAGRAAESFLIGDENVYWRFDLGTGDDGLRSLLLRFEQIGESTRGSLLRGTVLEGLPLPRRRARLDDIAPMTIEFAVVATDPVDGSPRIAGWSARGGFSKGLAKLRAAIQLLRFVAGRDPSKGETSDADGVEITEIRDEQARFAIAPVGNRILVASDAARLRAILDTATHPRPAARPDLAALHAELTLPGEDGWAYLSHKLVGEPSDPFEVDGAAAAFDVNDRDELVFRVAVLETTGDGGRRGFAGTAEDCAAVVAAWLPGIPAAALEIEGQGADAGVRGARRFSGRVRGLSTAIAAALTRVRELRGRAQPQGALSPETPSASPTRPSPGPPSDRRSDTPKAPPRAGSPTRPR